MKTEQIIHPFGPLYDENSEILILGSFPSVVSREQSFYYANRTNRFWPILGKLFDEEITDRRQFCLKHHIALWDVIYSCTIEGSSDASIRDVIPNDIEGLIGKTKIRAIFTTGSKSGSLYEKYIHTGLPHYALPSTSAANARMKTDDLLKYYSKITEVLHEKT